MQKTRFGSLILMACALLLLGSAVRAEPVRLERVREEGRTVTTRRIVQTDQTMTVAGMDLPTTTDQEMVVTSKTGKIATDGRLDVVETIESLNLLMELPDGRTLEFDSTNPDATGSFGDLEFLLETFRATAGMSWTKVFNKEGRVAEVLIPTDRFSSLSEMAREVLRGQFDPDQLTESANQELDQLPKDPVDVGDFWQRSSTTALGGGQTMDLETQFEYVGPVEQEGRSLDKVTMKVTTVALSMDAGPTSPVSLKDSDLSVDSSEGWFLFDREKGMVVSSELMFRVVGDFTLIAGGQELPADLDLTMNVKSEVE